MTVRSGRFRLKASAVVLYNAAGNFYRILNSSDPRPISGNTLRSFTVLVKKAGGGDPQKRITVAPTFSLDVKVHNQVDEVDIEPTTLGPTGEVEGIYDLLRAGDDIRSGRFNFATATTARHQIISAVGGNLSAMYRLFNSGNSTDISIYEVDTGGTAILTVPPKQSRDFNVDNRDIYVHSSGAFEGIYEFLQ